MRLSVRRAGTCWESLSFYCGETGEQKTWEKSTEAAEPISTGRAERGGHPPGRRGGGRLDSKDIWTEPQGWGARTSLCSVPGAGARLMGQEPRNARL